MVKSYSSQIVKKHVVDKSRLSLLTGNKGDLIQINHILFDKFPI